jgi:hypothetical protein
VAEKLGARKDGQWVIVGLLPDFCKTPGVKPPVPYPVTANLDGTVTFVPSVKLSMGEAFVYDGSKVPLTLGDQAGILKGIKSQTVGADCWPKPGNHSPDVKVGSRFLVREGDMFFMNGGFRGDVGDPKIEKAKRYECRKEQIEAGKKHPDKKVQAAANRFERNNKAIEKAFLSRDVYGAEGTAPTGWKDISKDPAALEKLGLKESDLSKPGSEFRARVYEPDPAVFGNDMKPAVAFKGTTPSSLSDWTANARQGIGWDTPYYRNSVDIGNSLSRSGADVEITGHSLGGGMASAASRTSGLPATTFNSAGLNSGTVSQYGGTPATPLVENIQAFRVNGEILTAIQEQSLGSTLSAGAAGFLGSFGNPIAGLGAMAAKIGISAGAPNAVGTKFDLPGTGANPVDRHGMDQVINGIESQKTEDQKAIAAATGIEC